MKITYAPDLLTFLKNKHLLLDTNVFRDSASGPKVFADFFNTLKRSDVTLTTIDTVKYELLKGSADNKKYKEKEKLIADIIDTIVPISPKTLETVYSLISMYGIDGAGVSVIDLTLGAILMQYKNNICLMTRDTTGFMQNIFDLPFIVNATHSRGIFTYGIYQFKKAVESPSKIPF